MRGTPDSPEGYEGKTEWRVLGALLPYLWEYRGRVVIAMAFLILAKLASVALPLIMKHIVDGLDASQNEVLVVPLALLFAYGGLRLGTVLFGELRDLVFGRVTEHAMRRIALQVFEHLHKLDLNFHLSRRTGGLSRDIERGTAGISFLLRFMLFNIIPTLLEISLVAGILLVNYSPWFAIITFGSVVSYIAFSVITTEWRTKYVRQANERDSKANTRAIDSLLNYETVKYFGNEQWEAKQYDQNLAHWEESLIKNRLSLATLNSGQALIIAGAVTSMMILAAQQVAAGAMTLGDLVLVNAYMIQMFLPLNFLGFVYREIKRALADMGRMFGLLEVQPSVADKADASALQLSESRVRFENVNFGYRQDRGILHGISFEIPPGKKLAVVGPSGAGKSTIARLLFRFYDVDEGRVCVNGQDIRDVSLASLRSHIGVVPQDTVLFNDTIRYNIAYGRPDATNADIETAAKLASIHEFIMAT
ncbi:MAG: ABC transporter transmembrane domain-containing protein, partial [Salinisphaeraceae bacterium]|nr:ABC transporter transmembrane domain-containing protein [Salinisphaeraceae bacterium]